MTRKVTAQFRSQQTKLLLAFCLVLVFMPVNQISPVFGLSANEQKAQKEDKALTLCEEGKKLLHDNRNIEALDKLREAAFLLPDVGVLRLNYALALAKTGNRAQAIKEAKLAATLDPNLDVAWLHLGSLYQIAGQLEDSVASYSEYLKRFPDSEEAPKIKSLIGLLQIEQKRREKNGSTINSQDNPDYLNDVIGRGVNRWPAARMPLKVYIDPGSGVKGYMPNFTRIFEAAFEEWSKASNGLIRFTFVTNEDDADIQCYFVGDVNELPTTGEAGHAVSRRNAEGLNRSVIKILTEPEEGKFSRPENSIRNVCLHEIGHALGLGGHSNNPDDVMYSSEQGDKPIKISNRDSATIVRLYQMKL